jgi:hypothetical protein
MWRVRVTSPSPSWCGALPFLICIAGVLSSLADLKLLCPRLSVSWYRSSQQNNSLILHHNTSRPFSVTHLLIHDSQSCSIHMTQNGPQPTQMSERSLKCSIVQILGVFQKYMFPVVRLGSLGSTWMYFRETHCFRLLSQNNQGRNIIKNFDLEEGRSMFLRNGGIPNATAQCNISENYNLKRFVIWIVV